MNRGLITRLEKLEAVRAPSKHGPWNWAEQEAAVERCALNRMSPDDRVVLDELFDFANRGRREEIIAAHRAVWDRWRAAFDWAAREVPEPYPLTVWDRWI